MNSGGALTDFTLGAITSAGLASTFQPAFLAANLTQWPTLTPEQQANVTSARLVAYLRGQTGYDENATLPENKLFRKRQAVLGDAVDSKPAFLGKPTFKYADTGYSAFKEAKATRAKMVFMGANDGMLHAFDANTLQELWAYVPSMVIPNMWKLADSAYGNKHSYYVNGDPIISDVYDGAAWRTILVAGLNGGGRGYYALDITDPVNPTLLWEFDANDQPNLGYTFGTPIITKKSDGTWVVLVTSGYNNIPDNSAFYSLTDTKFKPNNPALYNGGDGKGYLYILNALTGVEISAISTGIGSTSLPSGLAEISAYADDPEKNNTATYVYGGDLLGNLWRFNLADNSKLLFATLQASGAQAITTSPELGTIKNKRVVFVGTGKYLEVSDLTDISKQTLYAIKDDNATSTVTDPRSILVPQTIVPDGFDTRKSGTSNAVDFGSGLGWYIDFPDKGERQNVASQLVLGTLLVPTTVPTSSACQPAGYGWLTFLDYETGTAVNSLGSNVVSLRTNAPTVGFNVVYIDGKPKVSIVTADNPTPQILDVPFTGSGTGFQKHRSIWRELNF
jgi:type IV pilus assembly protein PilY1